MVGCSAIRDMSRGRTRATKLSASSETAMFSCSTLMLIDPSLTIASASSSRELTGS